MQAISRIFERDEISELISMAIMIYSIPRSQKYVDSFVVMPGLGETMRIGQAVRSWEETPSVNHLLIAGHNRGEKSWLPLNERNLREIFGLKRLRGVHVETHAEHTKDQAEWVVDKVEELGIDSLALFVSPFHLFRAFCTLISSLMARGLWIPIIPAPISVSPEAPIPELGVNAWDMIPGEVRRMFAYQKKGDVAGYEEIRGYISKLWSYLPAPYHQ